MSERVTPNRTYRVPMPDGDILLNASFDTLMYYEPLNAWWVRYIDAEAERVEDAQKMVVLTEENGRRLLDMTDLPYVTRESITELEHGLLVGVLGKWIAESMFDLNIDEQAIIEEEGH